MKLRAIFHVPLTHPLILEGIDGERFGSDIADEMRSVPATVDGLDLTVRFETDAGAERLADAPWRVFVSALVLEILGEEEIGPPPEGRTTSGGRDLTKRAEYFDARKPRYLAVAKKAADRVIRYFRFEKANPSIRGLSDLDPQHFLNPKWEDEAGNGLASGSIEVGLVMNQEVPDDLGGKALSRNDLGGFVAALAVDLKIPLHRELEANARDAARDQEFRRAVLELAIACEVAVKQSFFSTGSPAGEAFEYLEDKGKVGLSVTDFLKEPMKRAFAVRFDKTHAVEFERLDQLFQARNKVAHRGSLEFRDKHGALHTVDREVVVGWLAAAAALFGVLEATAGLPAVGLAGIRPGL